MNFQKFKCLPISTAFTNIKNAQMVMTTLHSSELSNLLEGSMFGDEDRVRKAIEDGEDIDVSNSNGWYAPN